MDKRNNGPETVCRFQCEPFCVVRCFALIQGGATCFCSFSY